MAEYRITAKLDPSGVVAGREKIEQELKRVDNASNRTTGTIERMSAAEFRAAGGADGLAKSSSTAATQARGLEQATERVLKAVDGEAAGMLKLNKLLADASTLHKQGAITSEQFAKVQNLVAQGSGRATTSLGQQRAGYTQLGFQIQDITQTLALGISPMVVLAQQGGQTASALSLAFGEKGALGKAATFMAGPFGSIILAATAILGTFAIKALTAGNEVDNARKKIEDDAKSTDVARRAKEAYGRTLDGLTETIRVNRAAIEELKNAGQGQARQAAIDSQIALTRIETIKTETEALITQARVMVEYDRIRASRGGAQQQDMAGASFLRSSSSLDALEAKLGKINTQLGAAQSNFNDAFSLAVVERAERLSDPLERIRSKYEGPTGLIELARRAASVEEVRNGTLTRQINLLKQKEAAEIKAQQASTRAAPSDGVARFRSREQAIGIAGRELQGQGLRIDGNNQFGRTTGHANDEDHNKFGIDVNVGRGVAEANLPDLRSKFEALARRYQARGYSAIFNGKRYAAFGNGPSGPAAGHKDHLHLYAPSTIVGRETLASTAAQEAREEKAGATVAEQKSDFLSGIVDGASLKGLPRNQTTGLQSELDKVFADYKRRFNEEMSAPDRAKVTKAITDADARSIAQSFEDAYITPLEKLQVAQGVTGISREVLNAQWAESARLGRELTPIEAENIENTVRQSDAIGRYDAILARIRQPVEDYKAQISALNALLRDGEISQEKFNYEVSQLPMNAASRDQGVALGTISETDAREQEILAEQARERDLLQQFYDAGIIQHDEFERRKTEISKRESAARLNAERSVASTRLTLASQIGSDLASIAEASIGKQNAVYKALFIASKAFAIADSIIKIQQGIAGALALPFPANIGAIASVTAAAASIISSIQSVALNLADGGMVGMVRGPGGPRADAVPANLSAGEYVVNSAAVARPGNKALLDAMNAGNLTQKSRRANDNSVARVSPAGDSYSLQFGDVVVQTGAGTTAADGQLIGRDVKNALSELVDERIAAAARPGGRLTRTKQSVVG